MIPGYLVRQEDRYTSSGTTYLRCSSRSELRQLKEVLFMCWTYVFLGKRVHQNTEIPLVSDHKFVSPGLLSYLRSPWFIHR